MLQVCLESCKDGNYRRYTISNDISNYLSVYIIHIYNSLVLFINKKDFFYVIFLLIKL